MSSMVEDRIEVGTSDMGNVFIFHRAERDGLTDKPVNDSWMVRAGNHTVATFTTREAAETLARTLCGLNVSNAFEAESPTPAADDVPEQMAASVRATRKRVSG